MPGRLIAARLMQGVEGWDVDLPTYLEASYIGTTAVKVMWLFCYILVYGIRPVLVRPKKVGAHPFLFDLLAHPRAITSGTGQWSICPGSRAA